MKIDRIVLAIALLLPALRADANTTRYYTGTACIGHHLGDMTWDRGWAGCTNSNYSPTYPDCGARALMIFPVDGNNSNTVQYVSLKMGVYIGHVELNGNNSDQMMHCTWVVTNSSGTQYYSTTPDPYYYEPGHQTIEWTGAELPNSGNSIANAEVQHAYCWIPTRSYRGPYGCDYNHADPLGGWDFVKNYIVEVVGS